MPEFLPGLELCKRYYQEVVRPLLEAEFPALAYSAALIGAGSEVLGFDTEMSADHDWGPRLLLFLSADDHARLHETLRATLSHRLPPQFLGYPTGVTDATADAPQQEAAERHRVEVVTIAGFFQAYLDFDIRREIEPADWLTFTDQKLRTITAGAVYHDGIGLEAVRRRFAWYPHDVWLYLLAAGWTRIGQEEHLMGRAGYVGDEIGSALIGSRLVRDLMRLCFLMEKQYAPYPKWFGTAFQRLDCAPALSPWLRRAQTAETWQEREDQLVPAYMYMAERHNALGLTPPLPTETVPFYTRPFRVIHLAGGFAGALADQIRDPVVKQIASRRRIGSIDQFSDSTDLLSDACWRKMLRRLYEADE